MLSTVNRKTLLERFLSVKCYIPRGLKEVEKCATVLEYENPKIFQTGKYFLNHD